MPDSFLGFLEFCKNRRGQTKEENPNDFLTEDAQGSWALSDMGQTIWEKGYMPELQERFSWSLFYLKLQSCSNAHESIEKSCSSLHWDRYYCHEGLFKKINI